ncbi:MAG: inorganic phosphate transporter [Deltaproteobacteria bacterium]|nr:inorganic phosphate transporter [Deltaproteobacteria bacterium]
MENHYIVLILGYIFGFYMAWNIGANDVANSMASAVGAKAITLRQAVFIAGILNIVGAIFLGTHVTNTIRKGIISTEVLSDPHIAMLGALSALLAAALWVSFATIKSLPVSTTHSIVGAMIGFGIVADGFSVIQWAKLGAVVASWIISPIFAMIISFCMFKLIVASILIKKNRFDMALKLSPFFIGITIFIVVMSFIHKTPLGKRFDLNIVNALLISLCLSVLLGIILGKLIKRFVKKGTDGPESVFKKIQIGTSCYVSLAQGANDVANAIGPLAVIYFIVKTGGIGSQIPVPIFLLLFGGVGIAAGIAMAGRRVIKTLSTKITQLNNTRGFSVDFAAATTVLIASKLGLPVSTTHAAVGGVLGVGLARGIEAVNFYLILKIILYWVLTVPAAAITCIIIFKILKFFI